jgi:putative transposase
MARRNVPFLPQQYYHVYNRGAHKADIFRNEADYVFLLKLVKKRVKEDNVSVIAYCLMSNHYHFLLRQNGEIQIGKFMQAIFNVYTKAFNAKYGHSGTLFEGPYRAIHIDPTEYLLHLCRYIHRNPIEAEMVIVPEQWQYSNYLEFVGRRAGTLVDKDFVDENFGSPEAYREFVMDYVPLEKTQKEFRHYLFWH